MSWRQEKTPTGSDLIYDGVETGIAPAPTLGTANIQNANIATETGEVLASYGRTNQAQAAISAGTLTASVSDGATLLAAPATLKAGTWIRVTSSSITSITAATNPATVSVSYLVVAGGGGGGGAFSASSAGGGGGGAGGMRTGSLSVSAQSYSITVGAGGSGGGAAVGTSGGNSIFSTITSTGGGGGAAGTTPGQNATNGGSGGGGAGEQSGPTTSSPGTGTGGQGNDGGGGRDAAVAAGGGGGGAGAVGGTSGGSGTAGAGGNGTASSISGTSVTYAGGGGGGGLTAAGAGGTGGGGSGGDEADGNAGTANTGGGGGGASTTSSARSGGSGGSGIVVISYTTGAMYATGGTITQSGGNTIHSFYESGVFTVHSIGTGGLYYVSYKDANNKVKLSAKYDPTGGTPLTHGTSGTATFNTVAVPNSAIAKATEPYTTATGQEFRYYMLDLNSYVWVYDTAVYDSSLAASGVGTLWMLPDPTDYTGIDYTGMAVLNGNLMVLSDTTMSAKPTVDLGRQFWELPNVTFNDPFPTHVNFAYVGHQGKLYYCDGNYIGEVFPTTSLETSIANIQSYAKYTGSSTTGTISAIIGGSLPYSPEGTRIPAVFFTDVYGTQPTNLVEGTVYYIDYNPLTGTFAVYAALTGGSAINIATGAAGNQYFNTFFPVSSDAGVGGDSALVQFSSQRVNLPFGETAQCMVEVGNTIIIGCNGSILYPWNQIDATPSDFIALPESNVKAMVNVNNMAYVFAGNKGNVYITNNSVASLALKVPDYCAGVPGTPLTYIEPYFTWGDATYLRGRVYFSILDQTSTKAGNCGGIWSFIPTQNFSYGQDVGMALRLENQSSYGDYDGVSTILIPNEEQNAVSPQYWSFWQDSYSTGTSTFGIDQTAATPVTQYVIETDLVPTGSMLEKQTFAQLEYKLTTPLATGDSVQLYYRLNSTDAWTTCGTVKEETTNKLAGYFDQAFQKTQWVQFRAVVTTPGTTASSFVRLKQIRLR